MINCVYCENVSTSDQVCTECGEPLVDNPAGDWAEEEFDGQPSMYEEYQDLYGGDDWDHGQYDNDCDCMYDC